MQKIYSQKCILIEISRKMSIVLLQLPQTKRDAYIVSLPLFSIDQQIGLNNELFCSGRISRVSLIRHSFYVGVVGKSPPPPLTGEQYGKMEPKYPEGGHCQSVLRPQGVFNVPLYFK